MNTEGECRERGGEFGGRFDGDSLAGGGDWLAIDMAEDHPSAIDR